MWKAFSPRLFFIVSTSDAEGVSSHMSSDTRPPRISVPRSVTIVLFAIFTRPLVARAFVDDANETAIQTAMPNNPRTPALVITRPLAGWSPTIIAGQQPALPRPHPFL